MANKTNVPEFAGQDFSGSAITDISAKIYCFVKDSSGNAVACSTGEKALGILQNAPVGTSTRTQIAQIRTVGMSKLKLGGTVAAGDYLKSDSSGYGVTASTDKDVYNAQALSAGVSGDIIAVKVVTGTLSV